MELLVEALAGTTLTALVLTAFVAGFIDAIAGGGGLITVPALALAGLDPVAAIATNKLQASFGSGTAAFTFWRAGHLRFFDLWPALLLAGLGSALGAALLTYVPREALHGLLPFVLVAVALYFAVSPRISEVDSRPRMGRALFVASIVPLVGFYDGIFGPGTGSFYMLGFVALLGYGIVRATAETKAVNFASNIIGLLALSASGQIFWLAGLAMGLAQVLGARLGARMAIRDGARLIKPLVVTMCLLLAGKLARDSF